MFVVKCAYCCIQSLVDARNGAEMKTSSPLVIFSYILGAVAIIVSTSAYGSITLSPSRTIARQLLLYLHLSLIVEEIVSLPFTFTGNRTLCRTTGFLHSYSGVSNVIAMWLITTYSVNYIRGGYPKIDQFIYYWKEFLCFAFPLITIFALISNEYGEQNDAWCELTYIRDKNSASLLLSIMFYYMWIWIFLILSVVLLVVALIDGSSKGGWPMVKSILSSTGAYGLISLIMWIPHTIRKIIGSDLSEQQDLGLTIPIYATGILYGALYFWRPKVINLPDKCHVRDSCLEFTSSDLEAATDNPVGTMNIGFDDEEGL